MRATVNVYGSSFRPSPSTFIVVLAWRRDQSCFHEDGLLIPSLHLADVARDDGDGHLTFDWLPASAAADHWSGYRMALSELRARVKGLS